MTFKEKILGQMPEEWQNVVIERMCPGEFIANAPTVCINDCADKRSCAPCWNQSIEKTDIKEELHGQRN